MNAIIIATITAFLAFPQLPYAVTIPQKTVVPAEKRIMPEVLEKIAQCESGGRHFDENGKVLLGVNKFDIGKYQINMKYWSNLAEELGIDIYTEDGNESMALELYQRFGTEPWNWSKKCWDK